MPTPNSTSIYLPQDLGERLRAIAERERRQIKDTVERMMDYYEPLTMLDHAILNKLARDLGLKPGEALSHVIQSWQDFVQVEREPQVAGAPR